MNLAIRWLVVLASATVLGTPAIAQDPRPSPRSDPEDTARRFLRAWREGDEETRAEINAQDRPDPFHVADALFGMHVAATLEDPPRSGDWLDAAESYSKGVSTRPAAEKLPGLVAAWRTLSMRDLQIEARLRAASRRVRAGLDDCDLETAIDVVRECEADLGAARFSLSAGNLLYDAMRGALEDERVHPRQLLLARRAHDVFERLGCRMAAMDCLGSAGVACFRSGDLDSSLDYNRQAIAEAEQIRPGIVARLLGNVSATLHRLQRNAEARSVAEKALERPEVREDPALEVDLLNTQASALMGMGEIDDAIRSFHRALGKYESLGDRAGQAMIHHNLAVAHNQRKESKTALGHIERALATPDISKGDQGDYRLELARTLRDLDRLSDALTAARESLAAADETGARFERAQALQMIGEILCLGGDYSEAEQSMVRALEEMRAIGARTVTARGILARILARRARLADALGICDESLAEARVSGRATELASLLGVKSEILQFSGSWDRSVLVVEEEIRIWMEAGCLLDAAWARYGLAQACWFLHRDAEALEVLERAAEFAKDGHPALAATCQALRGRLHGRRGESEKALEFLRPALAGFTRLELARQENGCLGSIGEALLDLGRLDEARQCFERALGDAQRMGDTNRIALHHAAIGRTLILSGDPLRAASAARSALDVGAGAVRGLNEFEAPGARVTVRDLCDLGIRALCRAIETATPASGSQMAADALHFMETGRAVMLLAALLGSRSGSGSTPPQDTGEGELRGRWMAEPLSRGRPPAAHDRSVANGVQFPAGTREEACAALLRRSRRGSDLAGFEAVSAGDLSALLPGKTALVAYHLARAHAVAIVAHRSGSEVVMLGSISEIRERAAAYLSILSSHRSGAAEEAAASGLYDLLVRPIEGLLEDDERILVSPDGVLSHLPFECLVRQEQDARKRLIERFEVV